MRQAGARTRRKLRVGLVPASAKHFAPVAAQPAEAGAEEEPPWTDTRRLAFAGWPGHNWCKMQRRRPVAFHILDKTFFRPRLSACLKTNSPDSRMLLNPKPAGQPANAAIQPASNSNRQHYGSHDDAFLVVGLMPPNRPESQSNSTKIPPAMRVRENINRSCTAQAPSLRLVRPTKREELLCEFISPLPQRFSEPHSPP